MRTYFVTLNTGEKFSLKSNNDRDAWARACKVAAKRQSFIRRFFLAG